VITTLSAIPDASNPAALDPTKPGKRLTPIMPHPSMRSRVNDPVHGGAPGEAHAKNRPDPTMLHELGKAIVQEAVAHSGPGDAAVLHSYGLLRR
jgi:hypothetical protein